MLGVGLNYDAKTIDQYNAVMSEGANEALVQLADDSLVYTLGRNLHYLVDTVGSQSIADVTQMPFDRWQRSHTDIPSFGFSRHSYWIYFDVMNASDQNREWFLELALPEVNSANLYFFTEGQEMEQVSVGSQFAFSERPIQHHNYLFPLQFDAGQEARIYLQLKNDGALQIPLTFVSERKFLEKDQTSLLVQGFYYGSMAVMLLYNLFVFISVRDRSYLLYVLYVTFLTLYQLSAHGLGFQYLWPNAVAWGSVSNNVLAACSMAFATLFMIDFLNLHIHLRRVSQLFYGVVVCDVISVVMCLVLPAAVITQVIYSVGACVAVLGLYAGFSLWHKGHDTARYFSIAFMWFFIGILLFVLNKFSVIPRNFITEQAMMIGAMLEVLLLSLALAERINQEKKKRFEAQKLVVEQLAEKEKAELKLAHRVLHDSLINCPNRAMLNQRMENLIVSEPDKKFAMLLLQLTRFHEINNTLGHQNGDEILKRVGRRLSVMVNNLDKLIVIDSDDNLKGGFAVLDGVSFCVMLGLDSEFSQESIIFQIRSAATKMLKALSYPFELNGMTLELSAKVGVSLYPEHGRDMPVLLQHAHVAVEVSHRGDDSVSVYSPEIDPYSARRLVLVSELRKAISRDELQLFYQPQLNLRSNAIVSMEALLRWFHPVHGFIPPDEFVLIAEQTGVIKPLTRWVLETAIRQTSLLQKKGHSLKVSVNISAKNLQEQDLVRRTLELLKHYDLAPSCLVLEVTETAIMSDPAGALETLCRISESGIGLSIDDFGTGYSSLAYLKRLPVDEIKIDRTFVTEMVLGSDDEVIVNTTLMMSHSLGLKVVAEGVENKAVLSALGVMNCDLVQGYFISKPVAMDAFEEWLQTCGYNIGTVIDINQSGTPA